MVQNSPPNAPVHSTVPRFLSKSFMGQILLSLFIRQKKKHLMLIHNELKEGFVNCDTLKYVVLRVCIIVNVSNSLPDRVY